MLCEGGNKCEGSGMKTRISFQFESFAIWIRVQVLMLSAHALKDTKPTLFCLNFYI